MCKFLKRKYLKKKLYQVHVHNQMKFLCYEIKSKEAIRGYGHFHLAFCIIISASFPQAKLNHFGDLSHLH